MSIVTSRKIEAEDMNAADKGARDKSSGKSPGSVAVAPEMPSGIYRSRSEHPTVLAGIDEGINGGPPHVLDRWFDEQLNRLFNDVSSEPLPPDLAKLVGKLRSQGNRSDDK
ncbi:MAG: hypothetical protein HYU58_08475 [Proteobacteria bacterium]|nr:hypothetical protein [Pseudomonadota bacterium]